MIDYVEVRLYGGSTVTYTNLALNPSSEVAAQLPVGVGTGAITQASNRSKFGSFSSKCVWASGTYGMYFTPGGTPITVLPSTQYNVSVWIYLESGVAPTVNIVDTSFALPLGISTVGFPTGVWTRISTVYTTGAAQTTMKVYGASASATTWYADGFQITKGPDLLPYFDGSFSEDPRRVTAWSGTAHNSSSTAVDFDYEVLPKFNGLAFDTKYNDVGAVQFAYPLEEAKALDLTDQSIIGIACGYSDGTVTEVDRYVIEGTNDEKVSDGQRMRSLQGRSFLALLDDAVVYPSNWNSAWGTQTVSVTNKALTSNVATLTTGTAHSLVTGQPADISGVGAPFDGLAKIVLSTPTATTFTYAVTNANIASTAATGSVRGTHGPDTSPSGHEFVTQTLGTVWRTLILRAKNRGTLSNIVDASFSGPTASNGAAWLANVSEVYPSGAGYLGILQDQMDRGLVDAKMDGFNLRLYNGGYLGNHIDIGVLEVRPSKNATELVTTTTSSESCSTVLIEGEEGTAIERHNSSAQTLLGRRRERYVQQGGIDDAGVLSILADAELTLYGKIPSEETVGLANMDSVEPFKDFTVADWVWVRYDTDSDAVERRVRQIAVTVDESRNVQLGVTLNSIILENDIKLLRKIEGYTGNGASYGNQPNTNPNDTSVPSPPTSLVVNSGTYTSQGKVFAAITLVWNAPTTNVDTSAITDLAGYEWQWKYDYEAQYSAVYSSDTTSVYYSPLQPGLAIDVRVRARDSSGHVSAWLDNNTATTAVDTTPPPTPATPTGTSRMGVVEVFWSGLTATATAQPVDFRVAELHKVATAGTVPVVGDPATKVGEFTGAGSIVLSSLAYASSGWYKIIALDSSNNPSTPSAGYQVAVTPIASGDLVTDLIDGEVHIAAGTVPASKLLISDFTNYLDNPHWDLAITEGWTTVGSGWSIQTAGLTDVNKYIQRATAGAGSITNKLKFPVRPGESIAIAAKTFNLSSAGVALGVVYYNAAGAELSFAPGSPAPSGTQGAWTDITNGALPPVYAYTFLVPNNAVSASFRITHNGTGTVRVANVWVRKKFQGNLIVDGTITTANLIATAIDGMTVTGATVQTSTTVPTTGGIKFNTSAFEAFAPGGVSTFSIDSVTGDVTLLGNITAGSTITGAVFQTSDVLTDERMVMYQDTAGGRIDFYSGLTGETPGRLNPSVASPGIPSVTLASGSVPSYPLEALIYLRPGSAAVGVANPPTTYPPRITALDSQFIAGEISSLGDLSATGDFSCTGAGIVYGTFDVDSGTLRVTNPPTGTAIPNTRFPTSAGGILAYTSHANSSKRYKKNIKTLALSREQLFGMRPVKYQLQKKASDRAADYEFWGFVAEEMQDLGFDNLLGFDEKGRPDEVDYAKVVVVQQAAILDLNERLEESEKRIARLEAALETLLSEKS